MLSLLPAFLLLRDSSVLNFSVKKAWIHSRNFFVISETGFLRITDFEKTRGMAISSSASISDQILSSGGGNWIGGCRSRFDWEIFVALTA